MSDALPIIRGVDGLRPSRPIGVNATVGRRGPSGEPVEREVWYLMAPAAAKKEFSTKEGKAWSAKTRQSHSLYAAWNAAAMKGDRNCETIFGRLIHASVEDSARWSRLAWKSGAGTPNPPSGKPWCEGNGIEAKRYSGTNGEGEEVFEKISCPGALCPYSIAVGKNKPACTPKFHLVFELCFPQERFAHLPQMICEITSGSNRSLESLVGMLESVAGTMAVLPDSDPATAKRGMLEELGANDGNLFGVLFSVAITQRTSRARPKKFPILAFSPIDVPGWVRWRKALREDAGALPPIPAALLGAAPLVAGPEFEEARPQFLADIDGAPIVDDAIEDAEEITGAPTAARLSQDQVFELVRLCRDLGIDPDDLAKEQGAASLHLVKVPDGAAAEGFPARLASSARMIAQKRAAKK